MIKKRKVNIVNRKEQKDENNTISKRAAGFWFVGWILEPEQKKVVTSG